MAINVAEIELEPCPFCGADAGIDVSRLVSGEFYALGCDTDHCPGSVSRRMIGYHANDLPKKVAGWNRRVSVAQS